MSNLKHLKEMMDSKLPSKEWHEKYNEGMKAKSKALKEKKGEPLNAWGQDAKTAKEVRKRLAHEKKMKSFNKHADERYKAGY